MEAASTAVSRGGAERRSGARRPPAALRREADPRRCCSSRRRRRSSMTVGIVVSLARRDARVLPGRGGHGQGVPDRDTWTPLFADPQFGIRPLVQGTLIISLIGLVVAIPLGLGTAIYLSEYAPPRVRKTVKPTLELLAGRADGRLRLLRADLLHARDPRGPLRPRGLGLQRRSPAASSSGIMIVPTIASIAEDAMTAVPHGLREGAYGVGASQPPGVDARRVPRGAVGHRRGDRARRLARRRRDDDRADRRRPGADDRTSTRRSRWRR